MVSVPGGHQGIYSYPIEIQALLVMDAQTRRGRAGLRSYFDIYRYKTEEEE